MLTRVRPQTFEQLFRSILRPLTTLCHAKPPRFKAQIFTALTALLKNWLRLDWPKHYRDAADAADAAHQAAAAAAVEGASSSSSSSSSSGSNGGAGGSGGASAASETSGGVLNDSGVMIWQKISDNVDHFRTIHDYIAYIDRCV